MEVNGIAHIQVSVNRFEECISFYDQLMPYLGLDAVERSERVVYSRADARYADEPT
jgi:catechol 2,3-dioxygenase-like lactoylglutathione lyase family enzyme